MLEEETVDLSRSSLVPNGIECLPLHLPYGGPRRNTIWLVAVVVPYSTALPGRLARLVNFCRDKYRLMLHSPSNQRDVKLQLEEKQLAAFILGRLVRLSALPICVEFSSLLNSAICLMALLARPKS